MNQMKFAVWIIGILLATACTNIAFPLEESAEQVVYVANCPAEININSLTVAAPGDTIALAVSPASVDWQYSWTTTPATELRPSDKSITEIVLPTTEGVVSVSVSITNGQGCNISESIEIFVFGPPSSTPTSTETSQPTMTHTPTSLPTGTSTATPTTAPSTTHTPSPTPTATATLLPLNTPLPTVPAFEIRLQEPKNETCVSSENAVFQWLATRPLNNVEGTNGEYYALNIWADGTSVRSISWIKEARYEIDNIDDPIAVYTQEINCSGENGCYWNVDLIVSHVERGDGWKPNSFTTIETSPVRRFCTYANTAPQPTNTPAPPPTATGLPPRTGGN